MAASLARQHGAELGLLHAWSLPIAIYEGALVLREQVVEAVCDSADDALARVATQAREVGAPHVTSRLVCGHASAAIIDALASDSYDLCVMGTEGRRGVSRMLLGSVAESVLRQATTPVLVTRPGLAIGRHRHVLCPTDFSAGAHHALELALQLVEPGGTVTLLHVLPQTGAGRLSFLTARLEAAARAALAAKASRVSTRATIEHIIAYGEPTAEIDRILACHPSIDLVVMGSAGRSGVARIVLGSVAEQVARHARVPVLVTRGIALETQRAAS